MKFEISGNKFVIDGKEVQILSGAIHYFRVVPKYWRDRLEKLKMCGFNTVETYIAWNVTEPEPDRFTAEGMADFVRFIETAEDLGLYVIVRPGPFICAEWEMGGFPAYLTEIEGLELRAYNQPYMERFDKYLDFVLPKLKPHLCTNGGGIIAMQVENEYGGFNKQDKRYLEYVREGFVKRGIDVLLFTSDGANERDIINGSLDDLYKTVNFGSRQEQAHDMMIKIQPDKPFFNMEFWAGWFDQWGNPHHTRDAKSVMSEYIPMVERGDNVNFYMFHGGTNFGFNNGSNCNPKFEPTITSYDYSAPLNEYGEPTDTYYAIQYFLSKHLNRELPRPKAVKRTAFGEVALTRTAGLFENLASVGREYKNSDIKNMEYFGQYRGFILYTFDVKDVSGILNLGEVHDRAMVYIDGEYVGAVERDGEEDTIYVGADSREMRVLVENMGHVNYGPRIYDKKGLFKVTVGENELVRADIYTLPMNTLTAIDYTEFSDGEPAFYNGTITIEETADTFLITEGFTKGFVTVNGFNLGRYWSKGPQKTLYVPAPILKKGENEIIVFDLYPSEKRSVCFSDKHILDGE